MSDLTKIAKQFPHARFHAEWNLVTWHPTGILDNERADRVVDFLESEEQPGDKPFHRFTNLNGYTRMRIGLDHIVRIARRRRRYSGPPVKSAFYATRPVSVIISRIYEELMDRSVIEVCTFRDLDAAADWLGVPAILLRPPGSAAKPASAAGKTATGLSSASQPGLASNDSEIHETKSDEAG